MADYNSKREYYRNVARKHEAIVEQKYQRQIQASIKGSKVYSVDAFADKEADQFTKKATQIVWPLATNQAVIKACKNYPQQKVAALNFASYINPGGGFLNGAMAQEEAICTQSDLYPVIASQIDFYAWNKQHRNRGLYMNRGLYSPDIIWDGDAQSGVITCAAPNKTAGRRTLREPEEQMKFYSDADSAMLSRMNFVKRIAEDQQVDVLILGAWGAGVFGFKPDEVAKMWQRTFEQPTSISTVVYAVIPDEHRRNSAVNEFKKVFE